MKILVTGIEGWIGRLLAIELLASGHSVCGLDRRGNGPQLEGVRVHRGDLRSSLLKEVLGREQPSAVVHLAGTSPFSGDSASRQRANLLATRALLDSVTRQGISRLVFLSRHLYYGAASDLPLFHREEDPPHGVETFPEVADLVASDLMAAATLWGNPRTRTVILRPCFALGASDQGVFGQLLHGQRIPTILGFDPLVQFLHATDLVRAIRLAIEHGLTGIFNVGANRPQPLSQVIASLGRTNVAIPEPVFRISLGRFGFPDIPTGALSLLKYPIIVDDSAFRCRTGFQPRFDEQRTLEQFNKASGSG